MTWSVMLLKPPDCLSLRFAILMAVRALPSIAGSKPRQYSLKVMYPDQCIFLSSCNTVFFPPYSLMSSAGVHKLYVAFTYSLIRAFYSVSPLSLSGCKSSSSSVWCQQCWLIKAVGRQCVIHSYS